MNEGQAIAKLDRIINLSRVEMYKPIQIAETLRNLEKTPESDPLNLESYRNLSREWRNTVTRELFGKVSTSSMRFQDDLWNDTAIPPQALKKLLEINMTGKSVEEYIYQHVYWKNRKLIDLRKSIKEVKDYETFLTLYREFDAPEFRSSQDRLFEVLSISTLQVNLDSINLKMRIDGEIEKLKGTSSSILVEFSHKREMKLKLGKLGHTNAADAGMDIWSNFGAIISVKNYNVDLNLYRQIIDDTPIGDLVIICKTHDQKLIKIAKESERPLSFITELDLFYDVQNYFADKDKCDSFLQLFTSFFDREFPLAQSLENFMDSRGYRLNKPKVSTLFAGR